MTVLSHTHLSPTDPAQLYNLATEIDRDVRKKRPVKAEVAKTVLSGIAQTRWPNDVMAADMHRAAHRIVKKSGIHFTPEAKAEIMNDAKRGNNAHAFKKLFV